MMGEFDDYMLDRMAPQRGRRRGNRLVALARLVLFFAALALFVLALWRGVWYAILAWLLTVVILVDTSVTVLFGAVGESSTRWYGFLYWLGTLFMGARGIQIVLASGEVRPVQPRGPLASVFARLGSPAIVIIENGVAAVFERSGRFTRVHGPGIVFIRRYERVAHVVDLRPQVRRRRVDKIMTRDGLSFDVKRLEVIFEVATDFDPQKGEYSFSEEAVLDLVYRGGILYEKGKEYDFGEGVEQAVEFYLRNVAARHALADLVRVDAESAAEGLREEGQLPEEALLEPGLRGGLGSARMRLLEEVEKHARPALRQIGIRLKRVDIGQIKVPDELEELLTLPLKQDVHLGRAQTQREVIIGIAQGLNKAILTIKRSVRKEAGAATPHVVVNLTDTLQRIMDNFLQLTATYREGPEVRNILGSGEGTGSAQEAP